MGDGRDINGDELSGIVDCSVVEHTVELVRDILNAWGGSVMGRVGDGVKEGGS